MGDILVHKCKVHYYDIFHNKSDRYAVNKWVNCQKARTART
jgi:hypothetical protein